MTPKGADCDLNAWPEALASTVLGFDYLVAVADDVNLDLNDVDA